MLNSTYKYSTDDYIVHRNQVYTVVRSATNFNISWLWARTLKGYLVFLSIPDIRPATDEEIILAKLGVPLTSEAEHTGTHRQSNRTVTSNA